MQKYITVDDALLSVGYEWLEIEEMDEVEIQMVITENDFRQCEKCGDYVHTDFYNGQQDLCDGCI